MSTLCPRELGGAREEWTNLERGESPKLQRGERQRQNKTSECNCLVFSV